MEARFFAFCAGITFSAGFKAFYVGDTAILAMSIIATALNLAFSLGPPETQTKGEE